MYTQPPAPPTTRPTAQKPVHKRWWFYPVVIGGILLVTLLDSTPGLATILNTIFD